jgi:hypothetical protein
LHGDIAYKFTFIDDTFISAILDLGKMFILPRGDEIIASTSSKIYIFLKLNNYIQPLQINPTKNRSSLYLVSL